MIFNHTFRCATLIALSLFLSACSLVPHQSTPQVDIAEHTQVSLPTPASLGYQLTASQLITASWAIDGKPTSEQLPVQLQVTNNEVVLAGFSSWGTSTLTVLRWRTNSNRSAQRFTRFATAARTGII